MVHIYKKNFAEKTKGPRGQLYWYIFFFFFTKTRERVAKKKTHNVLYSMFQTTMYSVQPRRRTVRLTHQGSDNHLVITIFRSEPAAYLSDVRMMAVNDDDIVAMDLFCQAAHFAERNYKYTVKIDDTCNRTVAEHAFLVRIGFTYENTMPGWMTVRTRTLVAKTAHCPSSKL